MLWSSENHKLFPRIQLPALKALMSLTCRVPFVLFSEFRQQVLLLKSLSPQTHYLCFERSLFDRDSCRCNAEDCRRDGGINCPQDFLFRQQFSRSLLQIGKDLFLLPTFANRDRII